MHCQLKECEVTWEQKITIRALEMICKCIYQRT